MTVRVSAVSPQIVLADVGANLRSIRSLIVRESADGQQLIVFPELATSGYVFSSREQAVQASLTRDDARWVDIHESIPEGVVVVVGYCESEGDLLYNTAAVLTRTERLYDYRKSHLWGAESQVFVAGHEAGAVVNTAIGCLGLAICYDNEFPEVPRRLALAGADVLALPVAWPRVDRPPHEHPPELIQAMASARSSRLPTIVVDRTGEESGVSWTGGTSIINGDGWVVASAAAGIARASLQITRGRDKSLPPDNDLFGDRRPELY